MQDVAISRRHCRLVGIMVIYFKKISPHTLALPGLFVPLEFCTHDCMQNWECSIFCLPVTGRIPDCILGNFSRTLQELYLHQLLQYGASLSSQPLVVA